MCDTRPMTEERIEALQAELATARAANDRLRQIAFALDSCVDFDTCDDVGRVGYALAVCRDFGDLAEPAPDMTEGGEGTA